MDCSVSAAWVFRDEFTPAADLVLDRILDSEGHVPFIWPAEMANTVLTAERRGRVAATEIEPIAAKLNAYPIIVDLGGPSLVWTRAFGLAQRRKLSLYDALYLELALRRGLPLATFDRRLREAAESEGVKLA